MAIEDLINSIDRHTDNGAIHPNEPEGESVKVKESIVPIASLLSCDWFTLHSLNLKE